MHTLHTTDGKDCRGEGGGTAYFAYPNIYMANYKENKRKAQFCLSYPIHTLHTTVGKCILCIRKIF